MENFGTFSLVEEETLYSSEPEEQTETKIEKIDKNDIDYIVLAVNNPMFKISTPTYDIDVCGKSMLEWVKSVCENPQVKEVEVKHNVLDIIKPMLGQSDITVVLYSDSPLITKNTIKDAIDYTIAKGINVCKLTHGFIFKTEYIKRAFDVFSTETHYFSEEDFLVACNFKQLSLIYDIAKNRIMSYHMTNGVNIVDPTNTYIGIDVSFGKNVIIYPNNIIYGKMEVGNNVTFFSHNLVGDSVLKDNSSVLMSRIKKSVIGKNVKVVYSSVDKSFVDDDCDIKLDSKITSCEVKKDVCIIGATLFNAFVGSNCVINSSATIMSYKDEKVVLKNDVIIGAGVVIPVPIVVGENSTILPTTTVRDNVSANCVYGDRKEKEIKPKV